jgi:hypothetical protein
MPVLVAALEPNILHNKQESCHTDSQPQYVDKRKDPVLHQGAVSKAKVID